jgi:hypothetical protein
MFVSGKRGWVAVGTTSALRYKFSDWSLTIDGDDPDCTNFESGGATENIDGIDDGSLRLTGPWDVGNMPLQRGTVYTFHLGVMTGFEFVINARVKTITPSQKVRGKAEIEVTAKTTGPFVAAVT